MAFTIKRGDTKPALRVQIEGENAEPINLATVSEVRFIADTDTDTGTSPVIDENDSDPPLEIIDAEKGIVQYNWQEGDTDEAEGLLTEFEVEYNDGTVETFPNSGYILISIQPDIG
jgi:hypothetical protein